MRKTKYILPAFSFYDRTGIQQYLEKKAREGWLLEKMSGFAWKFRRIEPKPIHYAVTYFPKASAFDPVPSEQQEVFREFCAHSGWVLAASSAQLQIFYNEAEDPVPIETDPEIELENIHKAAKKTYLPAYIMLIPLGAIQWANILTAWKHSPLDVLSNSIYYFNALCGIIVVLLGTVELAGYFRWRRRAKRAAAEDGRFTATRGRQIVQMLLVCIQIAALIWLLCTSADTKMAAMMIVMLVLSGGILAAAFGAINLMKRLRVSASKNRTVTFVLVVILSFAAGGLGTYGIFNVFDRWWPEEENAAVYEFQGESHRLYREDIPLKIQDMLEVDPEIYSYACSSDKESLLVSQYVAYQRPRYDMLDQPELEYTIVEVKADFLYDFCLNTMVEGKYGFYSVDVEGIVTRDTYYRIDEPAWGADAVYQLRNGMDLKNQYLLCYGDLIVELDPDWEMTDGQKATVGDIFG